MKLCKDCKHIKVDKCYSPHLSVDPVFGKIKVYYCSTERTYYPFLDGCGPTGKYFEPKEKPKWKIFIQKLLKCLKR